MQTGMTFGGIAALFGTMVLLALIPGVSVWAVSARSAAYGFTHGVAVTAGILLGDVLFIVLALFGLVFLAEAMGNLFVLIKYLGSAYLIWLGIVLLRSKSQSEVNEKAVGSSLLSSFLIGLLITFGDQKAILFYLGFLPAFLDLSTVSVSDGAVIVTIAALALAVAKLSYAYLAARGSSLLNQAGTNRGMTIIAGCVMIVIGIGMALRA